MSRIGNKAVEIPDKVKVNVGDGGQLSVEGPKGKLEWTLPREIKASVQDKQVSLARGMETRSAKALHGLSRSLVYNMVQGVSEGFTKQLEIEGVGFRAAVQGSNLNLSLGFSHPVAFPIPEDIKITVADNTKITIQGVDKKLITDVTVFDVYEGKGIDPNKKSIAIAVTIQPREKTLTDQEIDAVATKIVAEVTKKTGGTLRA